MSPQLQNKERASVNGFNDQLIVYAVNFGNDLFPSEIYTYDSRYGDSPRLLDRRERNV